MPAKGKRVASRQAQLNRRRRRQTRAGVEGDVQTAEAAGGPATATIAPPAATTTVAATETASAPETQALARTEVARDAERGRNPSRNSQPLAYTHLSTEFRRITILAGVVLVVLIAISFAI